MQSDLQMSKIITGWKPRTAVKHLYICITYWAASIMLSLFRAHSLPLRRMYYLWCCPPLIQSDFDQAFPHQDLNITICSANHQHCFDSACHLLVTHMVLSGLCSFLSTPWCMRDHLRRLSSVELQCFGKVEFHVVGLVYWILLSELFIALLIKKEISWACFVRKPRFEFSFSFVHFILFWRGLFCRLE